MEEEWRQRADDQGSAMPKIFGRTREKFEETSFDWPKERKRCEEMDWDWKKRELVTETRGGRQEGMGEASRAGRRRAKGQT